MYLIKNSLRTLSKYFNNQLHAIDIYLPSKYSLPISLNSPKSDMTKLQPSEFCLIDISDDYEKHNRKYLLCIKNAQSAVTLNKVETLSSGKHIKEPVPSEMLLWLAYDGSLIEISQWHVQKMLLSCKILGYFRSRVFESTYMKNIPPLTYVISKTEFDKRKLLKKNIIISLNKEMFDYKWRKTSKTSGTVDIYIKEEFYNFEYGTIDIKQQYVFFQPKESDVAVNIGVFACSNESQRVFLYHVINYTRSYHFSVIYQIT